METTLTLYVRYLAKPGCRESFLRQLTTEGIIDAIRREDATVQPGFTTRPTPRSGREASRASRSGSNWSSS